MLPVVLYNGDAAWKPATEMHDLIAAPSPLLAPYQPSQRHFVLDQRRAQAEDFKLHELTWTVAQLEQSSTAADLARMGRRLTTLLAGAGEVELRRTFAHWLWGLGRSLVGSGPAPMPPEDVNLEDVAMSLEERVAQWREPYIEQSIQQGRQEGMSLGREQGISLGREEGIGHERQLLRPHRGDAVRFGHGGSSGGGHWGRGESAALDGSGRGDCALRHGRRTAAGNRQPSLIRRVARG